MSYRSPQGSIRSLQNFKMMRHNNFYNCTATGCIIMSSISIQAHDKSSSQELDANLCFNSKGSPRTHLQAPGPIQYHENLQWTVFGGNTATQPVFALFGPVWGACKSSLLELDRKHIHYTQPSVGLGSKISGASQGYKNLQPCELIDDTATQHVTALSQSGACKSSSLELDEKLSHYDKPNVGLGFNASKQQEYLQWSSLLDSTATQWDTALLNSNQVYYGSSLLELNKNYFYNSKPTPRVDLQSCTSAHNVNDSVSCPSQPHHGLSSLELEHINPIDALQVLEDEI